MKGNGQEVDSNRIWEGRDHDVMGETLGERIEGAGREKSQGKSDNIIVQETKSLLPVT